MTPPKWMLAIVVTLGTTLTVTRTGYAEGRQETCDTVTIETAGEFRIKHSKIKGIATTHNRDGIAAFVELWPPQRENGQLLDLVVAEAVRKGATPDCKVVRDQLRGDIMSCTQNVIRGLEALARFKLNGAAKSEYHQKMNEILDYLTKDVFNCESSEKRANVNNYLN